ncbi:hypothetical protein SprV_0100377200 [Sparganum proliferum]
MQNRRTKQSKPNNTLSFHSSPRRPTRQTGNNLRSNRPEQRTVLVAQELARYKVDIAALSETRFSEQDQLERVDSDYTFWSGRPRADPRDAGVALVIRDDIVGRLPCLPQGINDRLMGLRLPLRGLAAAADENASVENRWCKLRDTVQSTALAVVGHARRQHQGWFDNDAVISNLLAENRLHKAYVNRSTDADKAFYRSHRLVTQRQPELQDVWTPRTAEDIQGYAGRNEWKKNFFAAIKAATVHQSKELLLFPAPTAVPYSSTNSSAMSRALQKRLQPSLHHLRRRHRPFASSGGQHRPRPPALFPRTISAVKQLSSRKAPGSNAIPAEIYKHGGSQLMDHLTAFFLMWRQGEIQQDFTDATIAHLYK